MPPNRSASSDSRHRLARLSVRKIFWDRLFPTQEEEGVVGPENYVNYYKIGRENGMGHEAAMANAKRCVLDDEMDSFRKKYMAAALRTQEEAEQHPTWTVRALWGKADWTFTLTREELLESLWSIAVAGYFSTSAYTFMVKPSKLTALVISPSLPLELELENPSKWLEVMQALAKL